jgi:membrane carboxypeptidase/penicillin-binding protein PbpC
MARAPRQPGSSFKPFVYAAAFEKGYSPATILFDVKIKVGEDEPQNFDGGFWGLMNARRALGASRNIPAIQAFFLAGGEDPVLKMSTRLGAPSPADQKQTRTAAGTPLEYGWPLSLGAGETPLLEMVQAYATFADQGIYKPLASIRRIKDRHGNILYELDEESQGAEVLDPRIAYQITSVLSDASVRPNEYWQQVLSVPGVQSAAKTGTSNKCLERDNKGVCKDRKPSDLWTIGYTPSLVTGVWVGNADAAPLSTKAESLTTAAPIWKDFMTKAHTLLKSSHITFAIPPGIVQPQISLLSGQLPTECTPVNFRRSDVFLEEYAPSLADPSCVRLTVDKATGLLASDTCPKEAREERSFFLPTVLQAERWPQWEQSVIEWANGQMSTYDTVTGSFSGSSMPLPLAPRESCVMSPERAERPTLTILSPAEGDGAPYPSFQLKLNAHVGSSIREIVAKIDGRVVGRAATDRNFIIRVPRSIASEGNHLLEVTLTDQYYNAVTASNEFHFTEDAGGPTLRLLSPVSDQHVPSGSSITIQARADDQEGGIKYVQFFLNDQLLSTKPKEPFELPYTFDVAPGTYAIRALATDLAGNVSEDTVMVIVEQ